MKYLILNDCCFKILSSTILYINTLKFASKGLLFNLLFSFVLLRESKYLKTLLKSSPRQFRALPEAAWWESKMSWMDVSISGGLGCEDCAEPGQCYRIQVLQDWVNMAIALQDLSCCNNTPCGTQTFPQCMARNREAQRLS